MPLWEVLGMFLEFEPSTALLKNRVPRRSQWSHSASRASRCWSMARTGHQVRPPAAQKQCAYDRYNSGMLHVTPCSTGIYYDSLWFYNILHVSTMKLWNHHLWWIWLRFVHHDPAGVYGACGSHIFAPGSVQERRRWLQFSDGTDATDATWRARIFQRHE